MYNYAKHTDALYVHGGIKKYTHNKLIIVKNVCCACSFGIYATQCYNYAVIVMPKDAGPSQSCHQISTYLSTGRWVPVAFRFIKYSLSAFLLMLSMIEVEWVKAYYMKANKDH